MKTTSVLKWLRKKMEGITHFRLIFSDVLGSLKDMNITESEIWDIIEQGQGFDGSSIEGFVRLEESDLMAHPRLKSFRILPAHLSGNGQPVGIFFCDIRTPEGRPFPGDPRQCLKRILRKAKHLDLTFYVGPELEFFLFPNQATPQPLDQEGYFDSSTGGPGAEVIGKIVDTLQEIGIQVECSHHEVAPSQFEIDVKYQDALTAADQVMLIRWVTKRITQAHGRYATFLPKPIFGINGSGMHTHMSLFKNGKNAFFSKRHQTNLSIIARRFTAGLLAYVPEFTIVTNQLVNSYKRIVPNLEAPCYISWGQRNRSSLVRVPRYRIGREKATRVELRSPDPSCNPYLAFAVMLAAGLKGIEDKLTLPNPVEENIFDMSASERKRRKISTLPGSLQEAIQAVENSAFLKNVLGKHIHTALLNNKRAEWEDYRTHVSQREIERFMPIY